MNNVNGNIKYQFIRKTNLRKKPPLYDLQQIALQQKRQNGQEKQEFVNGTNLEGIRTGTTTTTTSKSCSINDIFLTNEIEEQQQQQMRNEKNNSTNTETNPFCDNSYFRLNKEEDPFNHNARLNQQENQKQKFTPLALAAHATAMAVLQKDYHFNSDQNKRVSFCDGFTQQKQKQNPFSNNQFINNFDVNEHGEDDEWYTGDAGVGGLDWRSYATNENEKPNDMKFKSIIDQQQLMQQTPSKCEYNQISSTTINDVYNTTWCTNDLDQYNNYNNTSFTVFSNHNGNVGNDDSNSTYVDESTTFSTTSSTF